MHDSMDICYLSQWEAVTMEEVTFLQDTRKLTEGAILSGIFIVLLLLSIYVPLFMTILLWFLPLPFIIYTARHGLKPGIMMFVAVFLLSIFVGGLLGLPNTFLAGIGGMVTGELIRRKKEAFIVMAGSAVTYIAGLVVLYAASVLILQVDPFAVMQDAMRQSLEQAERMLHSLGQEPSDDLAMLEDMIHQMIHLAPLFIVFAGGIYALISQGIAHVILRRLKMDIVPFPPFREWNVPRSLLWYYLIVTILFFIVGEEQSALAIVVWNLFPLLEVLMAIQGFTVVFHYCYVKSISKALPIILVIAGFLLPIVHLFARLLGIIDLGFQLKKRLESDLK